MADGIHRCCGDPNCEFRRGVPSDADEREPIIDDGFGNYWPARCPDCGELSMEVVRPGKVQCGNCG